MTMKTRLWDYVGRFSLVHILTYTLIGIIFLHLQNTLPVSERVALDFYKPYPSIDIMVMVSQLIRGGFMALMLYPFYNTIIKSPRGWLIIFSILWGVALLCSVEPIPGSIEGLIYTETTLTEHFMVLVAGGIQALLFSWCFVRFERWNSVKENHGKTRGENNGY